MQQDVSGAESGRRGRRVLDPTRRAAEPAPGTWRNALIDGYLPTVAAAHPDRVAIVDGGIELTYGVVDRRVSAAAAGLQRLGAGPGEVVSWQLPNWHEAYVLHMAIMRIGAISNPIVPIYRHREVEYILREARSRVLVIPDTFRRFSYPTMIDELRDGLPHLEHVLIARPANDLRDGSNLAQLWAEDAAPTPVERSADDVTLLLFTSGTTARPKGALHTHNTLDYENRSIVDVYDLGADDVIFMPSPITHITGLLYGLQLPSMIGGPVILQDVWEPAEGLRLIERRRCTFTVAATPFLHGMVYHPALAEHDVSSMRVIACGGADVPAGLMRAVSERFGCSASRIYGSTEFPSLTTTPVDAPPEKGATTDGCAIGAARFRIVATDSDQHEVEVGEVGELLVTGPEMFLGYLRPQDNSGAFSDDGFFRTGDLAKVDSDGFVTIAGRKKDIVVRGGENISVVEIEDLLFDHPDVHEVAIVAMPDPVMVERCCAFVVPRTGACPNLEDLCQFLEQRQLGRHKLPERLELVAELPKTASGKVQKFRLREAIRDKLAAEQNTASL